MPPRSQMPRDASQMLPRSQMPRCSPAVPQMLPRCFPDASQMLPRCFPYPGCPDATQMLPSQMLPRCFPDDPQMLPRCKGHPDCCSASSSPKWLPNASQKKKICLGSRAGVMNSICCYVCMYVGTSLVCWQMLFHYLQDVWDLKHDCSREVYVCM